MKIRQDFVTNSSSSSYVIAYKHMPDFDEETLAKYPMLSCLNTLIETVLFANGDCSDTNEGFKIASKEELDAYFTKEWCWGSQTLEDILADEDEPYYREQYDTCVKALEEGHNILIKRVDYSDETLSTMLHKLNECESGVKIIYGD